MDQVINLGLGAGEGTDNSLRSELKERLENSKAKDVVGYCSLRTLTKEPDNWQAQVQRGNVSLSESRYIPLEEKERTTEAWKFDFIPGLREEVKGELRVCGKGTPIAITIEKEGFTIELQDITEMEGSGDRILEAMAEIKDELFSGANQLASKFSGIIQKEARLPEGHETEYLLKRENWEAIPALNQAIQTALKNHSFLTVGLAIRMVYQTSAGKYPKTVSPENIDRHWSQSALPLLGKNEDLEILRHFANGQITQAFQALQKQGKLPAEIKKMQVDEKTGTLKLQFSYSEMAGFAQGTNRTAFTDRYLDYLFERMKYNSRLSVYLASSPSKETKNLPQRPAFLTQETHETGISRSLVSPEAWGPRIKAILSEADRTGLAMENPLGPTGAGKTTFAQHLVEMLRTKALAERLPFKFYRLNLREGKALTLDDLESLFEWSLGTIVQREEVPFILIDDAHTVTLDLAAELKEKSLDQARQASDTKINRILYLTESMRKFVREANIRGGVGSILICGEGHFSEPKNLSEQEKELYFEAKNKLASLFQPHRIRPIYLWVRGPEELEELTNFVFADHIENSKNMIEKDEVKAEVDMFLRSIVGKTLVELLSKSFYQTLLAESFASLLDQEDIAPYVTLSTVSSIIKDLLNQFSELEPASLRRFLTSFADKSHEGRMAAREKMMEKKGGTAKKILAEMSLHIKKTAADKGDITGKIWQVEEGAKRRLIEKERTEVQEQMAELAERMAKLEKLLAEKGE